MSDIFNKKLSGILGKLDEKMLEKKLDAALDMLRKGDTDELAKKINKVDKNELISKIDEFDRTKLQEFNIDKSELKNKINSADLDKLAQVIGEHGDEIIAKIKDIIK